jgi:hypothetical protein
LRIATDPAPYADRVMVMPNLYDSLTLIKYTANHDE